MVCVCVRARAQARVRVCDLRRVGLFAQARVARALQALHLADRVRKRERGGEREGRR